MYDVETANPESTTYSEETAYSEPQAVPANRWQFFWLCGLILSFCYELPLVELTTMYRVNPTFFDIFFVLGMLTVFPGLQRTSELPKLLRVWTWIVVVFCVCAVVWFPAFPWYYGKYSLFFAVKYVEGLLMMYIIARILLTARQKKNPTVYGCCWGHYCSDICHS